MEAPHRKTQRASTLKAYFGSSMGRWTIVAGVLVVMCTAYTIYLFSGLPSLERIENPKAELLGANSDFLFRDFSELSNLFEPCHQVKLPAHRAGLPGKV